MHWNIPSAAESMNLAPIECRLFRTGPVPTGPSPWCNSPHSTESALWRLPYGACTTGVPKNAGSPPIPPGAGQGAPYVGPLAGGYAGYVGAGYAGWDLVHQCTQPPELATSNTIPSNAQSLCMVPTSPCVERQNNPRLWVIQTYITQAVWQLGPVNIFYIVVFSPPN